MQRVQLVHRTSLAGLRVLSAIALGVVLSGVASLVVAGHISPPAKDEGTQAHIFQLAIGLMAPAGLLFLASAEWKELGRVGRSLLLPVVLTAVAFVVLYCLEHLGS